MKQIKNPGNEPVNIPETVFEIGGEGGSISIYRERDGAEEKYITYHNEFDPLGDDETLINVKTEYKTFDEAFQYIERYRWYMLYIAFVHDDFKDSIIEKLDAILKEKTTSSDPSDYDRDRSISGMKDNISSLVNGEDF